MNARIQDNVRIDGNVRLFVALTGLVVIASACEGSGVDFAVDDASSGPDAGVAADVQALAAGPGTRSTPADPAFEPGSTHWAEDNSAAGGIGAIRVGAGDDARDLELSSVVAAAHTSGGWAHVAVDHVFANAGDEQLEGTFRFPVPPGAIVTGLSMDVNGKMVRGEIVEKRKAERIYRKIVDSMRDPALLRWQGAGTLELRVFPIPARGTKRIVLRFMAPLSQTEHGAKFRYSTAGVDGAATMDRFRLLVDGATVVDEQPFKGGATFSADVPRDLPLPADAVFVERRRNGERFVAVDLGPTWTPADAAKAPRRRTERTKGGRDVILLVDRSRSALEATKMQTLIVSTLVDGLGEDDRIALIAADIGCRRFDDGWAAAGAGVSTRLRGFITGLEADGASDLERAFGCVQQALATARDGAQVVYVGDGIATWGTVERPALVQALKAAVGMAPVHTVGVGKSIDTAALRAFAAATGGRSFQPRGPRAIVRIGRFLERARGAARLKDVRVAAGDATILPERLGTVFDGERRRVWLRVGPNAPMPEVVVVSGLAGDKTVARTVVVDADPEPAVGLRNQFGAARIEQLSARERTPEIAAKIVATSVDYDVLSELTALLVLESEEAYKQHNIKRKQKNNSSDVDPTRVTGADLESVDGGPSVSPNRIQPGDPEVRIPAPRNARSVTLTMPWGEVVPARWEAASEHGPAAWVGRFLVDKSVPEGTYGISVRIVHSDGRAETTSLDFRVDTTAPVIRLRLKPHRRLPGVFVVRAQQLRGLDARGVEVRFPDGQVVPLTALRLGRFVARWHPEQAVQWPLQVEVFAIDRALNQASGSLAIDAPGKWITLGESRPSAADTRIRTRVDAPAVGHDVTALVRWRGELLSGTLQDGIHAWRKGRWHRVPLVGVDRRINRFATTGKRLWIATARGLAEVGPGSGDIRVLKRGDGMPSDDIHSVVALPGGGAVAGTAVGAAIVQRDGIRPLGIKQGLPVRAVWDVAVDNEKALWLASSWGVYRWTGGKRRDVATQRFSVATGHLQDDWVTALAAGQGNRRSDVFVGTYKGGVTMLRPSGDRFEAIQLGGEHVNLGGLQATDLGVAAATMEGLFVLGATGKCAIERIGPDRNTSAVLAGDGMFISAGRASDKGADSQFVRSLTIRPHACK